MWDQPSESHCKNVYSRIIPTYVGSTCFTEFTPRFWANHSHVCGINSTSNCLPVVPIESFPRMWDQLFSPAVQISILRIIPTYVGSTLHDSFYISSPPNHSHVCGINLIDPFSPFRMAESFPRMWDQRFVRPGDVEGVRIIPTYVGSTKIRAMLLGLAANHSHVCGINFLYTHSPQISDESFPRMGDQLHDAEERDVSHRIIPTYVGSTM